MVTRRAVRVGGVVLLTAALLLSGVSQMGQRAEAALANAYADGFMPDQGGLTRRSPVDGMVQHYVPGGTFTMGSADDPAAERNERPAHEVELDGFWIDETEITNAMFERFVEATGHRTVAEESGFSYGFVDGEFAVIQGASWRHPTGPGSTLAGKADHPVVAIAWPDARAYCHWAERRLPTEAQWERAARGQLGRRYPWGDAPATGERVNLADVNSDVPWRASDIDDGHARTAPVGSYPAGASPVGALDMAGNAWEWVADWYDPNYYTVSPTSNPRGPSAGRGKVIRGGSYADDAEHVRAARRTFDDLRHTSIESGFRCAEALHTYVAMLPVVERSEPPTPTPTDTPTPTATPPDPPPSTPTPPPVEPCAPIEGAPDYRGIETEGGWDGRPAVEHPDMNLRVRGWVPTDAPLTLQDISGPLDPKAPRLYELLPDSAQYDPGRATFSSAHRVHDWVWDHDVRGAPLDKWAVTLVGMHTWPGQVLHVPPADYNIGRFAQLLRKLRPGWRRSGGRTPLGHGGYNALVLYATPWQMTIKYTREDNVVEGYTIHVENVCVEPSLLELYDRLNVEGRGRLPALHNGHPFGRARGDEILVSIRDAGEFMDPRARKDWWR